MTQISVKESKLSLAIKTIDTVIRSMRKGMTGNFKIVI